MNTEQKQMIEDIVNQVAQRMASKILQQLQEKYDVSEKKPAYTIAEAARRLGKSTEATRKMVGTKLVPIEGTSPLKVRADEVHKLEGY